MRLRAAHCCGAVVLGLSPRLSRVEPHKLAVGAGASRDLMVRAMPEITVLGPTGNQEKGELC